MIHRVNHDLIDYKIDPVELMNTLHSMSPYFAVLVQKWNGLIILDQVDKKHDKGNQFGVTNWVKILSPLKPTKISVFWMPAQLKLKSIILSTIATSK